MDTTFVFTPGEKIPGKVAALKFSGLDKQQVQPVIRHFSLDGVEFEDKVLSGIVTIEAKTVTGNVILHELLETDDSKGMWQRHSKKNKTWLWRIDTRRIVILKELGSSRYLINVLSWR